MQMHELVSDLTDLLLAYVLMAKIENYYLRRGFFKSIITGHLGVNS